MKCSIILFWVFFSSTLMAQKVELLTYRSNAVWPMTNIYFFSADKTSCNNVIFKSNNGKIIQEGCKIVFTPDTIKETVFKVYRKKSGKLFLIDTVPIFITSNEGYGMIGGKKYGKIPKELLVAMAGLVVKMYVTDGHSEPATIESYRLITIRNDSLESSVNTGPRFNEQSNALVNKLKSKDTILFTEIKAAFGQHKLHTNTMEFTIE